jgi:DedD protein
LLVIILILVALAAGVFALNYFGIIHLWGKKDVQVTETLPPPDFGEPEIGAVPGETEPGFAQEGAAQPDAGAQDFGQAPATTLPEPSVTPDVTPPATGSSLPQVQSATARPAVKIPASGTGNFTVQVSAWMSRGKADEEASRLTSAGYTAFVEDANVDGEVWYRVRVGRYATEQEAKDAAALLQPMMEGTIWVARTGQ